MRFGPLGEAAPEAALVEHLDAVVGGGVLHADRERLRNRVARHHDAARQVRRGGRDIRRTGSDLAANRRRRRLRRNQAHRAAIGLIVLIVVAIVRISRK